MKKITIFTFMIFTFLLSQDLKAEDKDKKKKEDEKELIVNITPSNYDEVKAKGIVFVDFWAAWCPPCRRMNPVLQAVATEREGIAIIAKLNVDQHTEFATEMRVFNLPTIIVYKDGKELSRVEGLVSKQRLLEVIDYLHSVEE